MTTLTAQSPVFRLHPQVSVRPEPFGALLYHFGNRKLSFLKDPALLALIESFDGHTPLSEHMASVGITPADEALMLRSLEQLEASQMVERAAP